MSGPDLDRAAEELVARLASGPTAAIGLAKQAMNFGQHATLGQSLNQELFNLELSCRTGDFKKRAWRPSGGGGIRIFVDAGSRASSAGPTHGNCLEFVHTPHTRRSLQSEGMTDAH